MADGLPFASGEDRLRLLYRLPLSGDERSFLVIGSAEDARRTLGPDRLAATRIAAVGEPWADSVFDVVALPATLLAPGGCPRLQLTKALAAVKPGGCVVGHLEHLRSIHALKTSGLAQGLARCWRARSVAGGAACLRSLRAAGMVEANCFYVEPSIDTPMALVPIDVRAARTHFVRAISRTRSLYSPVGYQLRGLIARAGLGGALQPHLFFWGRRPC